MADDTAIEVARYLTPFTMTAMTLAFGADYKSKQL